MGLRLKKRYIILISIALILIIIRLLLPGVLLNSINHSLEENEDYDGHVEDIDLSLYRGAYIIKGIEISKKESAKTPLEQLNLVNIELALEWKALFKGRLAGHLIFNQPKVVFSAGDPDSLVKDTVRFKMMAEKLMPLKVNRFEIINGSIHYIDNHSRPKVNVSLEQVNVVASNLSNVYDSINELPSTVSARAKAYEGTMYVDMKLNALASQPAFDLNAELNNTNLVLLNDFFKAYGNFTVNSGSFSLFTEMAASKGSFEGYVKPIIKDLDVLGPEDRNRSIFQKAWEALVGAAGSILKNQKEDQVATKIPIEGSFRKPETKVLYAVGEVLKNAFIQALMPGIDNQINYRSVKRKEEPDVIHRMAKGTKEEPDKKDNKKDKKDDSGKRN
jgi:hypothetical protein